MRYGLRAALACVLVVSLSGCSTVKGWFSMDDDDATKPAELQDIEQQVHIRKLWSTGVGDGQGSGLLRLHPVLSGDVIYAAANDGEVRALDRERGKTIWRAELDLPLSGGVGFAADALLLGSSEGDVVKLDADSGEVQWSVRLGGEILSAPQSNGREVVLQSYDGKMYGLDFSTGEKLWTYDSNVPVLTLRGTSTPIVSGDTAYAAFANGRVAAFDMASGGILWEERVAIAQGRSEIERIVDVDGSMVLAGKELYAASYQGRLVAIDVSRGRKLWQQDVSSFSGVNQGFGNVYVADENGTLSAYLRTGQGLRWSQDALAWRALSRPTPVSSYVAVGDFEGYIHFVSQVDGDIVGRVRADSDGVRADMISDGNILYVYGNSGDLIAYEITAKGQ